VAEDVLPVYSRYWLHGTGPAPAGNLPVAVHLSPTRLALPAEGESGAVRLTVACGPAGAAGEVELVVPAELDVTPILKQGVSGTEGPLRYELDAGGHAGWDLMVRARPGTGPGRYFVAARTTDASGLVMEDAAMVGVGEKQWPDRDLPPEEAMERMLADYSASAAEVALEVLTPGVQLAPGQQGELIVRVTSHLASELRGEAVVVSPFGSWELIGPRTQAVTLAPETSAELRFLVTVPAIARPGSHWWTLVKFMYFGRVWYTESVPVTITAQA
jgi:hypothetical protein